MADGKVERVAPPFDEQPTPLALEDSVAVMSTSLRFSNPSRWNGRRESRRRVRRVSGVEWSGRSPTPLRGDKTRFIRQEKNHHDHRRIAFELVAVWSMLNRVLIVLIKASSPCKRRSREHVTGSL